MFGKIFDWFAFSERRWVPPLVTGLGVLLVVATIVGWYWSREPAIFWVDDSRNDESATIGFATTSTLIRVSETLMEKPGGLLVNDVTPPSLFLDNMPSWEIGVLLQVRDLARILQNDYSRSQSQSTADQDLLDAEAAFFIGYDSWMFPAAESKYSDGIASLRNYQSRLLDAGDSDAQFFARADNLREWLGLVEKRLGNLSQRLTASVGQTRVNTDLAGDSAASAGGGRSTSADVIVKTSWWDIDNVFYEARGTAWALVHFLRATQFDFADVLEDKNATVSLRQIIRELEASLAPVSSPMILNGKGYGMFANHSLVMASYLSRANAAVIDLRELLDQG